MVVMAHDKSIHISIQFLIVEIIRDGSNRV